MSYRYGRLRGFIASCVLLIATMATPFCATGSVAAEPKGSTDGSVEISANIPPVRIVVVDLQGRITQILSNGPGNITPSVHQNSSEGPAITMNRYIAGQYTLIMRRVDQHKTG